jgi:hypothetical protein
MQADAAQSSSPHSRAANPDQYLTGPMFRKRAFTPAREPGIDMKQASIASGCNVDTLMMHHEVMVEPAVPDEVCRWAL